MAVIMVAVALVVVLGVLTLYAQRRSPRVAQPPQSQSGAADVQTKSDCDRPPAPVPPPPAAKPSGGEGPAAQASPPPKFLTFAACGDSAKPPAKPKAR
jgi:hypothetical protein